MSEGAAAVREPGPVATPLAGGFAIVRGSLAEVRFATAAADAGLVLPTAPCTYVRSSEHSIYWLGPDEWLLAAFAAGPGWQPPSLAAGAVVDVSGTYVGWRLTGQNVRQVLQHVTSYDVHPRVFPPGRCASTVFAKATALIAAEEQGAFVVLVRRSYGHYVQRYLAAVGEEYGIEFHAPAG